MIRPINNHPLQIFFRRAVRIERKTILELMEVRKGLEVLSAALAAERRSSEDLDRMTDLVANMRRQLHTPEIYSEFDVEFHLSIASATRNAMIYHLVDSIREPLKDAVLAGLYRWQQDGQLERVQIIHEDLLEKLIEGDAEGAGQVMMIHLDKAVAELVKCDEWIVSG